MPEAKADRDFVVRWMRRGIIAALTVAILGALLWVLKAALTPLVVAFGLAYLLDPVIDRFEARRVRRGLAILLLVAVFGGGLAIALLFVLPRVQAEVAGLAERMPHYLDALFDTTVPWLQQRFGLRVPGTWREALESLSKDDFAGIVGSVRGIAGHVVEYLTNTVSAAVGLLVIPILAFYLLVEFDHLVARIGRAIPPRFRPYVFGKARQVDTLVSRFLRGQLLIAAALAVLYSIGFSIIGIDLAFAVGALAGVLGLVPYLGNAVALLLASGLSVLEFGFDWHLAAVLGWYAIVQNLEGFVLTPRILGTTMGLHPAVVIVALLIGGDLFGFLGLMLAVPAAAVVKVFAEELFELYRGSELFVEPVGATAPATRAPDRAVDEARTAAAPASATTATTARPPDVTDAAGAEDAPSPTVVPTAAAASIDGRPGAGEAPGASMPPPTPRPAGAGSTERETADAPTARPDPVTAAGITHARPTPGTEKRSPRPGATTEPLADVPASATEPLADSPARTTEPLADAPASATEPLADAPARTTEPLADAPASATEPLADAPARTTEPLADAPASATEPLADVPAPAVATLAGVPAPANPEAGRETPARGDTAPKPRSKSTSRKSSKSPGAAKDASETRRGTAKGRATAKRSRGTAKRRATAKRQPEAEGRREIVPAPTDEDRSASESRKATKARGTPGTEDA